MKTSLEILAGIMLLVSIVSGTIQTYPTDFGKVQIDMPYILAPEDGRFISGTSLQLGLEIPPNDAFPNIKWLNIMGINLHNPATYGAKNVEDLTNLMLGNTSDPDFEYQVQEMITNDNHRMLFYTEEGVNAGIKLSNYSGIKLSSST